MINESDRCDSKAPWPAADTTAGRVDSWAALLGGPALRAVSRPAAKDLRNPYEIEQLEQRILLSVSDGVIPEAESIDAEVEVRLEEVLPETNSSGDRTLDGTAADADPFAYEPEKDAASGLLPMGGVEEEERDGEPAKAPSGGDAKAPEDENGLLSTENPLAGTAAVAEATESLHTANGPPQAEEEEAPETAGSALTVLAATINGGDAHRSLVTSLGFQFSGDVSGSLGLEDFFVRNLTTDQIIDTALMALSYDPPTSTATLTFPGLLGGSLPNGNYLVALLAGQITAPSGEHLDGNDDGLAGDSFVLDLFRYFGDLNGDRDVDFFDAFFFQQTYLKANTDPSFDARLDSDGDGDIDSADLFRFQGNYFTILDSAPGVFAALANDTAAAAASQPGPCVFEDGLPGWTAGESGGSMTGHGGAVAAGCDAILREGDSFLVTLERAFTIPDEPVELRFSFEDLSFDTNDSFIKDAFEVAFVDSQGRSLVLPFESGRDSFFNITEGEAPALGNQATISVPGVPSGARTVSVDISSLVAGTEGMIIFRLVNNDSDTETSVRITSFSVLGSDGAAAPQAGTPAGHSPAMANNADGVTSDPEIEGRLTGAVAGFRAGFDSTLPVDFIDIGVLSGLGPDGVFSLTASDLDAIFGGALPDGAHTLHLRAEDGAGALLDAFSISFILDTTGPSAALGAIDVAANSIDVVFDEPVLASAFGSSAFDLEVDGGPEDGRTVSIAQVVQVDDRTARIVVREEIAGRNFLLTPAQGISDAAGNTLFTTGPIVVVVRSAVGISEFSPFNGEELVSPAREAIVRFDGPVDPATVTASSFYLIANGAVVTGTVKVSSTRRFATFFSTNPLPASTEIRIVVDGNLIRDAGGALLDADGDGIPGGIARADYRTLSLTPIPGTNLFGFVRDSFSGDPIEGVTIRLDALPGITAVTDATGRFELQDLPAPEFFVHVDGTTATNAPPGTVYPNVGKPFHSVPGQTTQLSMSGVPFDIYLPSMALSDIQSLSPTADTEVGFGPGGLANLLQLFPAIDPAVWERLAVTFPAGSAIDDAGNPATQAAIIPVPPDRIPAPLPAELDFELVVSIQAMGASNFDVPAPITFPNLEGLAPGEKSIIFSFNHDAGEWIAVGTGTVSEDGLVVVSDPGVGILAPGWHGVQQGVITRGGLVLGVAGGLLGRTGTDESVPQTGRHFWVVENLASGFVLRGSTDVADRLLNQLVLAANTGFRVSALQLSTLRQGSAEFSTPGNGSRITMPTVTVERGIFPDSDGDGLNDEAEFIVGTAINNPDTDGDGINDLAELRQGLDPFDGLAFPTGVIASLPLGGDAREVVVAAAGDNAGDLLAFVATGDAGLAVVDVTQFNNPVILGQIDLPGLSTDVAVDANLMIAAVSSGAGGLHLVDFSDPMLPALLRTIDVVAGQVEIVDSRAYVTVGAELRRYDLLTGELSFTLTLGALPSTGMASEGFMLYTMDAAGALRVIDLNGSEPVLRGSLDLATGESKLFAGNDIVYAPAIPQVGVTRGGYSTIDVSDPDFPVLLADALPTSGSVFSPGRDFAANGSGLGLLVGFDFTPNAVDVMDTSDPGNSNQFQTRFVVPGRPYGVAIAGGIGFVAADDAGLQIVNYLSFDSQGQPPTVTISTPLPDFEPGTPGFQVLEGSNATIRVEVVDDVQVSFLELLVNGRTVSRAVSFPFAFATAIPNLSDGPNRLTVQVRATDTGGNTGLSNLLEFEIVPDTVPPAIEQINPADGEIRGLTLKSFTIAFSEPMDGETVTAANIVLVPESDPGNALVPGAILSLNRDRFFQFSFDSIPADNYSIVIDASAITDRAGNALGTTNIVSFFFVADADVVWVSPVDGFWDDAANWEGGAVPGPGQDVFIGVPGNVTVTHRSGTTSINSLSGTNTLAITGGVLEVATVVQLDSDLMISGGTLKDATVLPGNGGEGVIVTNLDGTLDGVTLDADITLRPTALVTVENGIVINGMAVLESFGSTTFGLRTALEFPGTQTLGGSGQIVFSGSVSSNSHVRPSGGGTLTIGPGITIRTGVSGGTVGDGALPTVNQGTIIAETPGETITVTGDSLTNEGLIDAAGGSVTLENNWQNHGTLRVSEGTFKLGGNFNIAGIGNFERRGGIGVVDISGTIDNAGSVLVLDESTTGDWRLAGGRINGGTVVGTPLARLFVSSSDGILDGVTLDADLILERAAVVTVFNNLTLNGTAVLQSFASNVQALRTALEFSGGAQTLGGTGQLVFDGSTFANTHIRAIAGGSLTIGPGITIRTGESGGTVGEASAPLTNQGRIVAEMSGLNINVTGAGWSNEGVIEAVSGTVTLLNNWSSSSGVLRASGGELKLGGTFTTADLAGLEKTAGATDIRGILNNTGATLALNATTGDVRLDGGRINGGTITGEPGAMLIVRGTTGGTLDGVILEADVTLLATAVLTVFNDLILNGTAVLESFGSNNDAVRTAMEFSGGAQTLGGTGQVVFNGSFFSNNRVRPVSGAALTIGPGITIRTGNTGGSVGQASLPLINQGRILAETASREIVVSGTGWSNEGILEAAAGDLTVLGNWEGSAGILRSSGGMLNLGGTFTTAGLGAIENTGGRVNIVGILDNSADTLALDGTTGDLHVAGGRINGGVITGVPGVRLIVTTAGGTLDTVTVDADMMLESRTIVTVFGGLTLNGTVTMETASSSTLSSRTSFDFMGAQTLQGTGEILFTGPLPSNNRLRPANGQTLTIGAGITIRTAGSGGTVGDAASPLIQQGTIRSETASRTITITGTGWTNEGLVEAVDGSVSLAGSWSNTGTLRANGGTLDLGGAFTTAGLGTLEQLAGRVNITGQLDNTGAALALNATTGDLFLHGGQITGGNVTGAGGARLIVSSMHGTLDGVTMDADMTVEGRGRVTVLGGLTLNGTATLVSADSSSTSGRTSFEFPGDQALLGTGMILFSGSTFSNNRVRPSDGGTLTIGPGITIASDDRGGIVGDPAGMLIQQGTVISDAPTRTITVTGTSVVNEGTLRAEGDGELDVVNLAAHAGMIEAGAGGVVNLIGGFTQSAAGLVAVELGGTAAIDRGLVAIDALATLDGTLDIRLVNGFEPVVTDSFTILTFGSRSGQFSTVTGLSLPGGLEFAINYSATNVVLTTQVASPEPSGSNGSPSNNNPVETLPGPGTPGPGTTTEGTGPPEEVPPLPGGDPPTATPGTATPPIPGGVVVADSRGTDFWLTFPANVGSSAPQAQLSLLITAEVATVGSVEIPGLGFFAPFTVIPGTTTTIALPPGAELGFASDSVLEKGVHVISGRDIAVYGLSRAPESSDAFLALPAELLGKEHFVLSYKNLDLTPNVFETFPGTQFAVVGTEDGTTLTITPSVTTGLRLAGAPYVVSLDQGEVYLLQNFGFEPSDLSGTRIVSDKPVSVFGSHSAANVPAPATAFADFIVEQLPPVKNWGTEFVTSPLATRTGDTFRFLAAKDNTTVMVNGLSVAALDSGEFHEMLIAGAAHILADGPILVAQYANSTSFDEISADPSMILVAAVNQYLDAYTVATSVAGAGSHFINLVTPDSAVGTITLDGVLVGVGEFTPAGASGFSYARLSVSAVPGTHTLAGAEPFGAFVYGFGVDESYGYPAGLALRGEPTLNVASLALTPPAAAVPIGSAHVITAQLVDENGDPAIGVDVEFSVAGANPAGITIITTDITGRAVFAYTGFATGLDTVTATAATALPAGTVSDVATVDWEPVPLTISILSPGDGSPVEAGDTVLVSGRATLGSENNSGVIAARITHVTVDGQPVDSLDALGNFFTRLTAGPGLQTYSFTANDSLGQQASTTLTLDGTQPGGGAALLFANVVSPSLETVYGRTSFDEANNLLYVEVSVRNAGQFAIDAPLLVAVDHLTIPTVRVAEADGLTPSGAPYYDFTSLVDDGTLSPGESSGVRNLIFFNPDRVRFGYDLEFFAQLNKAPLIVSVPPAETAADRAYTYEVEAVDPDGDDAAVVLTLLAGPQAMTLDAASGVLSWTPAAGDMGTHLVVVQAEDARGGTALQQFLLTVTTPPSNRPPVFTSVPVIGANVNTAYAYQPDVIDADDPSGAGLLYELTEAPAGMTVDAATGLIAWTPAASQLGLFDVALRVTDGAGGEAVQEYAVFVQPEAGNHAPVIVSEPELNVVADETFTYDLIAVDTDGDAVQFVLETAPAGMTLDPVTSRITWLTTAADLGPNVVVVRVIDGRGGEGTQSFTLLVTLTPVNNPPLITSTAPVKATESQTYGYFVEADDQDGDTPMFELTVAPAGMSIGMISGFITWTPGNAQLGPNAVTVLVSDGNGGMAMQSFSVEVVAPEPNEPPVITSTPLTDAVVDANYRYQVISADPNGDFLLFELLDAPQGMTIDDRRGILEWTPAPNQPDLEPVQGAQFDVVGLARVTVQVSDGRGGSDLQVYSILVRLLDNLPPRIDSLPPSEAVFGELFRYDVNATDPDPEDHAALVFELLATANDLPAGVFNATGVPASMSIDPSTGVLVWVPSLEEVALGAEGIFGVQEVTLRVRDGRGGFDLQRFAITVRLSNAAPVVTSTPPDQAVVDISLTYRVRAQDANLDTLTFSLDTAPAGVTIGAGSGVLMWTPLAGQLGDQDIVVLVDDGNGGQTAQAFTVTVLADAPNLDPVITSSPRKIIELGQSYFYSVDVTDPNNDMLTFNLVTAPAGMTVDAFGFIAWDPQPDQVGPNAVEVEISDGRGGLAAQAFFVTVLTRAGNEAPRIVSTPPVTARAGNSYIYDAKASDPEGDPLFWSLRKGPVGMSIDSELGTVRWTPAMGQAGINQVIVQVFDAQGGLSTQSFSIGVMPSNLPPVIRSVPETEAQVNQPYVYAPEVTDFDGDSLTFFLETAPAGMTIDAISGLLRWTPGIAQIGVHPVSIRVEDGRGGRARQAYTLAANPRADLPPAITSIPPFVALVGAGYSYQVEAADPDGDVLMFMLEQAPAGMSVDLISGLVEWVPAADQGGGHQIIVVADDGFGGTSTQTYNLFVRAGNAAPVIVSGPVLRATADALYAYDAVASDPDGDPVFFELLSGPEGMTIDDFGRVRWSPGQADLGPVAVVIEVFDVFGASATQSFDLLVVPDSEAPMVFLTLSPGRTPVGSEVLIRVLATDNVGVTGAELMVNGEGVTLDPTGRAFFMADTVGSFEVRATAIDANGNAGSASRMLLVFDPAVTGNPVVAITSPLRGEVITAPQDVIGTVTDADLLFYSLTLAPINGGGTEIEVGAGTAPVTGGVLGRIDPTLLNNDAYILRLSATDAGGNTSTIEGMISIAGNLKLGNFSLSFTDLNIAVSGIPVTVSRTYESLNANSDGDFGFGWQLDVRDVKLTTSAEETGLEGLGLYTAFGLGERVYVQLPGGVRQGFTFKPRAQRFIAATQYWIPEFEPDPGVFSSLTVPEVEMQLSPSTGRFGIYGMSSLPYNPADPAVDGRYFLKTADGLEYEIDGRSGRVTSVKDTNENTVFFTREGIFSESGPAVVFERDSKNRIVAVTDPSGNKIRYSYDGRGDLVAVTDRDGSTTQFLYRTDPAHLLEDVIDPLGRTGARSEYDDEGRLLRVFDSDGNPIMFDFDPENRIETIVDALGNPTILEMDARGNRVREIDPLGGITERTFDENDNLTSVTDPLGNTTTFDYDAKGNLTRIADPLGNVTTVTYGPLGKPLTLTDPLGNTTINTYDSKGNLLSVTDPLGNVSSFKLDGRGNPMRRVDAEGNITEFRRNSSGVLIEVIDAAGNTTARDVDDEGNLLGQTKTRTLNGESREIVESFDFNSNHRPTRYLGAMGGEVLVEYDGNDNLVALRDPLGRVTRYFYDDRGNPIRTLFPDGLSEIVEFDAADNRISQIDRAGRVTRFEYDAAGRLTATIYPDETPGDDLDNPRTGREYDLAGRLTAVIDELGNRTEFEYDAAGRLIVVRDALGRETRHAYDGGGRRVVTTDALGRMTRFVYDAAGRLVETVFADDSSVSLEYDERGNTVARTDQAGRTTRFEYDELGRLTAVVDALDQRTSYSYDEVGNLISTTDANNHVTLFEYDDLGRRTKTTRPLGEESLTSYDAAGNVVSTTDFNGETIIFEYGMLNELTARRLPGGGSFEFTYTPTFQRESVTDARGVTTYAYDARDRLVSRTDPDSTVISYTYDAAGNLTSVTSPAVTINYTYDALNRLESVTDPINGVTTYSYDEAGNLFTISNPNGVVTTHQYDSLNRLTNLSSVRGIDVIQSYVYTLDDTGRRTRVVESHTGRQVDYIYDELHRLIGEEITDPVNGDRTISYTYDAVGNRLTRDDSVDGMTTYTYDDNDRLLTETGPAGLATYEYDDNGNLIRKTTPTEVISYVYNAENRLVSVTDSSGTTTYSHDADGNRLTKTRPDGKVIEYLVDTESVTGFAQVLEERDGQTGQLEAAYVYGLDLISIERPVESQVRFFHHDGQLSTRVLTDGGGTVTDTYVYDAFGILLASTGATDNSYLYTGEQFDAEADFYYLRARHYDASAGRFTSADPFGGNLSEPSSLHRYLYTANDPVNNVDPSGALSFGLVSVTIGATLGALIGAAIGGYFFGPSAKAIFIGFVIGAIIGGTIGFWIAGAVGGAGVVGGGSVAASGAASETVIGTTATGATIRLVSTPGAAMRLARPAKDITVRAARSLSRGKSGLGQGNFFGLVPFGLLGEEDLEPAVEEFEPVRGQPGGEDFLRFYRSILQVFTEGEEPRTQNVVGALVRALDIVLGTP